MPTTLSVSGQGDLHQLRLRLLFPPTALQTEVFCPTLANKWMKGIKDTESPFPSFRLQMFKRVPLILGENSASFPGIQSFSKSRSFIRTLDVLAR